MYSTARKERAKNQNIKITYFNEEVDSYQVGILGSRRLPYLVKFTDTSITCTCPDFSFRTVAPICKHIYFIIHLARNNLIFNTVEKLEDLISPEKIATIKENLLSVIDKKKMEANNSLRNRISIERDDCCSICTGDLENNLEKCSACEHVLHLTCLESWWRSSPHLGVQMGKCPYCRNDHGFGHIFGRTQDPWDKFNFIQEDGMNLNDLRNELPELE